MLIRLARGCPCARRVMMIEEVSQLLRDAVATSRASPESVAFNHEIEPGTGRQNETAGGGIVCSVSAWFSPPGVRYGGIAESLCERTFSEHPLASPVYSVTCVR